MSLATVWDSVCVGNYMAQPASKSALDHKTRVKTYLKANERDNPLMEVLRYPSIGRLRQKINTTQKLSKL